MTRAGAPIAIVDYGVVNLGSIRNMLHKLGFDVEFVSTPDAISRAGKIILPGVGAFDNGISALADLNLIEALRRKAEQHDAQILGICLGMQLLGQGSEEGSKEGLGIIDGSCVRLRLPEGSSLKVPHMGWNVPKIRDPAQLLSDLEERARFYFTHSYHLVCADRADVLATVEHGIEFAAAIRHGNVVGVQFHPEKSHRFGMTVLRNFGAM